MSKELNPTEHPALATMEALWLDGYRATEIVKHLADNGQPPVKVDALARYGQRNWNKKLKLVVTDTTDLEASVQELESTGLKVSKISRTEALSHVWEKQEDGSNKQVLKPTSRTTIEVKPDDAPSFERATLPNITVVVPPTRGNKPDGIGLAISIPDMQIGYYRDVDGNLSTIHDERVLNVQNQIMAYLQSEEEVDLVVWQGDNADFAELGKYRTSVGYMGNTQLTIDRLGGVVATQRALTPDATLVYINGNHECLHENALAVTMDGLKKYEELEIGDLVLSTNDDLQPVWQAIQAVHVYDYDGDLVILGDKERSQVQLPVTPNHRVVGISQNNGRWMEKFASQYKTMKIPVSSQASDRPDYHLTDSEIKLAAWCLTDSTLSKKHEYWSFHQSEDKINYLREVLDGCGFSYTESPRLRDTKEICGKTLKSIQTSYDIYVGVENSRIISKFVDNKEFLPDWLYQLSDRQLALFIREWQITDGTTLDTPAFPIYCSRPIRFELQMLLIQRGYGASIKEYRPGHWRLNITPNKLTCKLETKHVSNTYYNGKVWCVTVENGRFFTSYNGHISLTGNSRLTNLQVDKTPDLVGLSRAGDREPVVEIGYLCRFDEYDVEHIDSWPNGSYWANKGLEFIHGSDISSAPGATAAKALSKGHSVVYGHTHRQELVQGLVNDYSGPRSIFAGSAGCSCKTDGSVPSTKTGINPTGGQNKKAGTENWHQGMMIIYFEKDGYACWAENIRIEEGRTIFRGKEYISTVDSEGNQI